MLVAGACNVAASGRSWSLFVGWEPLLSLEKLGRLLLLTSDRELAFGSLEAYAESPTDSRFSLRSLSFEWKGFETRHLDFFSLSEEVILVEGIVECEALASNVSSGGTAGVSPDKRFAEDWRRLGDEEPALLFTSLLPCRVGSCMA